MQLIRHKSINKINNMVNFITLEISKKMIIVNCVRADYNKQLNSKEHITNQLLVGGHVVLLTFVNKLSNYTESQIYFMIYTH